MHQDVEPTTAAAGSHTLASVAARTASGDVDGHHGHGLERYDAASSPV
jgi:hypothetical protein